ncbi:uncharacterized protein LOC134288834 [Aedes albopictus]|uniref:Endonuclease n=1 Tax=Aedes albopictus TaxID=7160 RepID=A0ABM1Z7B0_AEDAL
MSGIERKLRYLNTRRRSILTSLASIEKFVASYQEERDEPEIAIRLEAIVSLWTEFNKVQADLETTDETPDALEQYLKERIEFENSYYKVKGFLSQRCPTPASMPTHNPPAQSHSNHVKLPDVKLPVFTGNYETWLNFHDLFVSLVHSSLELSSIQKFYYLRSSLAGEALKLIQTIPISATNYSVAWNLLVEHFQNPKVLKRNYVQALFDFPVIRRESPAELHSLVEKYEANVKVLKQLGESTEYWDILLIHFLSSRLDPVTRRDWEELSATQQNVTFKDLTDFIQRRVSVLQQMSSKQPEPQQAFQPRKPPNSRIGSHGAFQENRRRCLFCPEEHPIYMCQIFSRMPEEEKKKPVKRHQLCRNCFRKGHMSRDCPSENCCRRCNSRHHTQLCTTTTSNQGRSTNAAVTTSDARSSNPTASGATPTDPPTSSSASRAASITMNAAHSGVTSCNSQQTTRSKVLLATAVVIIVDDAGKEHFARALLDSGSECCFATSQLSQMMNVKRTRVDVPVAGIGKSALKVKHQFRAVIKSRNSDYTTSVDLLILPKVTMDLPSTNIDVTRWDIPSNINLADPAFFQSSTVDIVLGAEIFFDLFSVPGRITLDESLPLLANSVFGWVVSGRTAQNLPHTSVRCNVSTVADLQTYMEKFWKIEEDASATNYSPDETACEEFFQRTVTRDASGRYIVRLPFKESMVQRLGDNQKSALHRFRLLENRLSRDASIAQQYREFMSEYLQLGHMAPLSTFAKEIHPKYYLPHHPVIRESSTTTKLRVVFDASSKTSSGISLNDALLVGPIVQDDLRSIVMRSRTHEIVLIADAEKMYRQVRHFPEDYAYLCIFWRLAPDQPIQTFVLQTVTYGTASAPYLATRVLKQLANDEAANYPIAAQVVENDFYVDDLFTGAATATETLELREQLDGMLSRGGFTMRKWASNCEAVLEGIPLENRALQHSIDLDRDQTIKTLGLHWEPGTDHLKYKIDIQLPPNTILTKRLTLSYIAQLFDPLGLVGPVVVTAKAFMQTLWTLRDENGKVFEWDRELPASLKDRWCAYHSDLPTLNELRINRFVLLPNSFEIELHVFSDASDIGYGTCAYLRSIDRQGQIKVALLTSRSKIAPLKRQSTPRLELCGALLSAELYQRIAASLHFSFTTVFWTDSTTVISWLRVTPSTWTTFVANRVSKIQHATQNCGWNHIAGLQNPADVISRGCLASEIVHNKLWWGGPDWLRKEKEYWPVPGQQCGSTDDCNSERRKTAAAFASATTTPSFIDEYAGTFSNYSKMIRITAYWRRFFSILRSPKEDRTFSFLTTDELKTAEHALIRLLQQQCFPDEWRRLQSGQHIAKSSRLRWFHPMLSSNDNVIRIGGRLGQSTLHDDFKHPILLPGAHRLSTLLLSSYHERLLHAAPQLMVNTVRLKYWLLGGRSAARQVVHKCVTCVRARPKLIEQFMSELPAARVTAARPFSRVGIDFWGPIQLQPRHRRDAPIKAYVAVFVCFATKAVHLELVANLTTAKFLQAFRRFVARRGLCSDVYTDNGKNFVGAANELKRLVRSREHKDQVAQECTENGIRWHFNPPKGSHFGGLWEAAIRSAQKHFMRVLGSRLVAYDDMETLLAQIECCLNSRPLTPMSEDPSDLDPLTPGHFLVGSALKAVPDVSVLSVPYNRLTQLRCVACIMVYCNREIISDVLIRDNQSKIAVYAQRVKRVTLIGIDVPFDPS